MSFKITTSNLLETDDSHELVLVRLLPLEDVSVGGEKPLQRMSHLVNDNGLENTCKDANLNDLNA